MTILLCLLLTHYGREWSDARPGPVFLLILVVMYLHYYYCNILVPNAFIYVQTRLVTLLWYEQGIFSLGTALTGHFLFLLILSLDP